MAMRPKYVETKAFHVVGMCGWFTEETGPRDIPRLWDRFGPRIDEVPGKPEGFSCYGVCFGDATTMPGAGPGFFYMAAAEVRNLRRIPADMVGKTIPAGRYAVFAHRGGLAGLPAAVRFVFHEWLPRSKRRAAPTPDLEVYGPGFSPESGRGLIEIRVPLLD